MEYRAPHPLSAGASYYPHPGVSASKIAKRTDIAPNKGGPFAAALRTLAKNAGPDAKDGAGGGAETKEKAAPAPAKRASPHHLPASGFQPYRPDDRLAHPAAASFPLLEPAYSPYAHPGLYSSAALQYRLAAEEQMYLERMFRGGVGMGVGWLPPYALYPPLAPPLPLVHPSHPSHPHAHAPHAPHPAHTPHVPHAPHVPHHAHAHALHDDREKEIALQRERDREREREREREHREKEQRERERSAREKESRRELHASAVGAGGAGGAAGAGGYQPRAPPRR